MYDGVAQPESQIQTLHPGLPDPELSFSSRIEAVRGGEGSFSFCPPSTGNYILYKYGLPILKYHYAVKYQGITAVNQSYKELRVAITAGNIPAVNGILPAGKLDFVLFLHLGDGAASWNMKTEGFFVANVCRFDFIR